ncbi:unnamed protein product [Musa acuminata subsp. malaccensis]|uniref:(wild Malaysian banana) hypothetical protein n=1 Tax=Musa acuminata subsp. malaccensis TaxID=214687 RepID=A0A804JGC8_MUSAM|nr:unnamed protein product [Musa acuminata subsp. malaccensis]
MTVTRSAVSTMFIVFVCTRLICARMHLRDTRMAFLAATRSDLGILEHGVNGLEPVVVANFPIKKFGDQSLALGQEAH